MTNDEARFLAEIAGYNETTRSPVYRMGYCVRSSIYDEWEKWQPDLNEAHAIRLLEGLQKRGHVVTIAGTIVGWSVSVDGLDCNANVGTRKFFQTAVLSAALKLVPSRGG